MALKVGSTCGIFVFGMGLLAGLAPSAMAAPPAVTPQAIAQPLGQNSTLIPTNFAAGGAPAAGNIILDNTFAGWVQGAVTTVVGGKPTSMVGDATFAFQQCFGGGFLDDLNTTLTPAGVNWVGGAASSFDEPSYGQNPGAPVAPVGRPISASTTNIPPADYWTTELWPTLVNNSDNATSINTANTNDPYGTILNGGKAGTENGQLFYPAGMGTVNLTTANTNRYAILFAGMTNNQRYFTDVSNMYNQLAVAGYQITVLFGDGKSQIQGANTNDLPNGWKAQQATSADLQAAIGNVGAAIAKDFAANKTNDQFFFYATDHGGNTQVVGPGAGGGLIPGAGGPPGTTSPIQISPGVMGGLTLDPTAVPTITLNYTMTGTDTAEVLFNGDDIGDITSATNTATLEIPDADITAGLDSLQIQTLSGPSFTVDSATFFSGADNTLVPVPEPATIGLIFISGISLLARRGSRKT